MEKIKIIHVVHDFLFGGIESYLYYLVQAQLKNPNLDVSILCCQEKDKVLNNRLNTLGINIYYVRITPFDINFNKYLKINKIVSNYDIVQLHIFKPLLLLALHSSGSKVLFTVHTAGSKRRLDSGYNKFKNKLQVFLMNYCCQGIINNSKYSQEYWLKLGVGKENNVVIYNGVHFIEDYNENFAFELFPQLINKFVIGTTSRFISWKRVDYLIEAFKLVKSKIPNSILLLVGDGPEIDSLKALTQNYDLNDSVIFAGYQTNVTSFQSLMNVCVFPSASEPFGLVAVECLYLNKPVLVMKDGGGLSELISQYDSSFIADSIEDLGRKIIEIYFDSLLLNTDNNSKKVFSEKFNIYRIESEYYKYYQQINE